MCEPGSATLAYVAIASTVASTAVSVMGAQQQAAAQSAAANYQSQVAANNAIIARQNADAALEAGRAAEQQQRMKSASLIGSMRAAQAANGVSLDSGSVLDVQADAATLGELDALTIRNNAARQAWAYESQASNFTSQSQLDSAQAGWAKQAGMTQSMGSLLGGAASVSNQWATYDRIGAFNSTPSSGANYGGYFQWNNGGSVF